jgi:hypothetical protein
MFHFEQAAGRGQTILRHQPSLDAGSLRRKVN